MKKALLSVFCVLFLSITLLSQTWEKSFSWGSTNPNFATRGYCFDNNGGMITVSPIGGSGMTHRVIRIKPNGDTIWNKFFALQSHNIQDWFPSMVTKVRKNYLLSGYGSFNNSWSEDGYFSILIDSNGVVLHVDSTRLLHIQGSENKSITSKSGKYCYNTYSRDTSVGSFSEIYIRHIIKYDSLGQRVWSKKFRSVPDSFITIRNIKSTNDDGIMHTKSNGIIDSLYKLDGNKNIQWSLRVNNLIPTSSIGSTAIQNIICTKDTNYILSISWAEQTVFPYQYKNYLIKLNSQGVLTDSSSYPGLFYHINGIETSNNKLLYYYLNSNNNNYLSGFKFFDQNMNHISTHPTPFSYNGFYFPEGRHLIANNMGGAFACTNYGNSQFTYAINFDSTFAAYPNHINSKVVLDYNKNCVQNTTDSLLNNSVVTLTDAANTSYYAFSDGLGNYNITIPNNTYTLTHTPVGYKQFECPGTGQITYSTSSTSNFNCTFFDTIIPNIIDVNLYMASDYIQSDDTSRYFAFCLNEGTTNANGTITIIKDPCLQFISSIPAPLSINSNTLTYAVSNLNPDSTAVIQLFLNTCNTNAIGSTVYMYCEANFMSDVKQSNNFDTIVGTIYPGSNKSLSTTANSKIVSQPLYINGDKELVYRIKYQNTTNQTIKDIIIMDTISNNLDVSSFKLLSYTGNKPSIKWGTGNKMIFTFTNSNLPSSIVDANNSKGEMIYAIKPKSNLAPNTAINNSASIYFDYVEAYNTSSTKNIIRPSIVTQIAQNFESYSDINIFPNPANNIVQIKNEKNVTLYYEIIDIQGKYINQKTKLENDKIHTGNLTNGIYILKITESNRSAKNLKLIISH
ncbi:MAG: T9SS type A sorting domain-containing protein [Burkholderiales bacterium]|nr:T9SS type A sorting domain-containing protein [Bacteroidia bacterium]